MATITISRGSFSGGKAVAEGLAERLGYALLSREQLLAEAADDYGISETELSAALDQTPPFWQQVPGKRLAYVRCVTAVLLDHVRHGDLVYHGYVGHLLLAGITPALAVRVIADLEMRIGSAMRLAKLSRGEALAYIQRVDRRRARWAKLLYGVDWHDPDQYDLTVNLARVPVPGAIDAIASMVRLPEYEPSAQSLKKLEDHSLSCRVWAALARDPAARSAEVHVEADAGRVCITGRVSSVRAQEAIPRLARQVEGIRTLQCDVGVGIDWCW